MIARLSRKRRVVRRLGKPFAANPLLAESLPRWRSRILLLALSSSFALLAGRAAWLQLYTGEFLQRQGAYRYARTLELPGARGRILDRHGGMLAASVPALSVWAVAKDLRTAPSGALRELARLLEMREEELAAKLAPGRYVELKAGLDPALETRLAALRLPGLTMSRGFRRVYPQGAAASQLVGFTGRDGKGLEGIELADQPQLEGHSGYRRVIRDRLGNIVDDDGLISIPRPGRDAVLSIDGKLQYAAYQALKDAVGTFQARAGSAIAVDVQSGEILALANYPAFDPEDAGVRRRSGALRNRALTDSYKPGSVLKPFTVALALERGNVKPETLVDTGNGRFVIKGAPISDTSAHGLISVSDVLRYSSNIGTAKLALDLPARAMWDMFTALGFGQAPQLGFPGAAAGRVRPYRSWRPVEQATMSYGNGIAVSLVQLARAYTVFAQDGKVIPLTLRRSDGPAPGIPVISPATAAAMRRMLEDVVQQGTAKGGRIAGYRVGAKTGTAYKAENGRYVFPRKYVASFAGMVPMSAPRFVVAVMIDEPAGRYHYGGQVAAPVFTAIAAKALQRANIAPDAPVTDLITPLDAATIDD